MTSENTDPDTWPLYRFDGVAIVGLQAEQRFPSDESAEDHKRQVLEREAERIGVLNAEPNVECDRIEIVEVPDRNDDHTDEWESFFDRMEDDG